MVKKLISTIGKHYFLSLLILLIITAVMGYITYEKFKLKTALTALLPEHTESIINLNKVKEVKGSTDNLVVVLETIDIEKAKEFAVLIDKELKGDPLISSVEYYKDLSFIKDRMLLQVSLSDLTDIKTAIKEKISEKKVDRLTDFGLDDDDSDTEVDDEDNENEGDPFKKEDSTIGSNENSPKITYNNEENKDKEIMEGIIQDKGPEDEGSFEEGDPFREEKSDEKPVLKKGNKYADTSNFLQYLDDTLNKYNTTFSNNFREWRISKDGRVLVVMITPSKPAGDIDFAKKIKKYIEAKTDKIKQNNPQFKDIIVGLSGSYITTIEETNEVKHDVFSSIGLSIGLILLLILLYFGRISLLITIIAPLLAGMIWTSGIFFLFEPHLNLIAAFIFAILLGLGIDFGIHVLSRYIQERKSGKTIDESLLISLTNTGKALVVGGTTTMAAFLSLLFADFQGFSQFGKLASLGVFLNLVAIYFLFPTIIFIFENHLHGFKESKNYYKVLMDIFRKKSIEKSQDDLSKQKFPFVKTIITLFSLIFLFSVAWLVIKPVHFEYNFKKLGKKGGKRQLLQSKYSSAIEYSLSPAVILTESPEETLKIHKALEKLTKTETDIIPQPAIFPFIQPYNVYITYNMTESIKNFASIYSFYPENQEEKFKVLTDIDQMLTESRVSKLKNEEQETIEELRPYLKNAKPFKLNDLPEFAKQIFKNKKGNYEQMLFLYVKLDTSDGKNAIKFAKEIRSIRVDGKPLVVTAQPLIFADILTLMARDGFWISMLSLGFITIILLIFTKSVKKTALLLIPLSFSFLLMFAFMSLFGIKLSFYNMIILPSLIGMGIDNAVHLYHRVSEEDNFMVAYKSIFGSITLATVTTLIGFAGLLTANHNGLNSIGALAIIGMGLSWVVVSIFFPALLQLLYRKKSK
ncbi:MMPL family transporter [bacterium]|nr:MMPL family transporter [bacterium]